MPFLEEYTMLDELGQGGYATVYKVRHNQLGYIRAIRVLNAVIAHGKEDSTYQKFLDECRLLLRLGNGNHPNIVHIYQPLLLAQRAIVEMDYVDGEDLYHHLKRNNSFVPAEDVMRLLTDIGSALAYCHEDIYKFCMDKDEDNLSDDPADGSKMLLDEATRKRLIDKYRVIHNDIHSGNIIRRKSGSYVLLDFGLAIEGTEVVRSSRRRNGAPEFKSPEKWDNDMVLTTQSDIYSFGVVLYEFLTGRVPFPFDRQNSNPVEAEYLLGKAHKEQTPEPIFGLRKAAFEAAHPGKEYRQDYPQWLEDVIMKCLAKDPAKRYRNGRELYDEVTHHMRLESRRNNSELAQQVKQYQETLVVAEECVNSLNENLERAGQMLAAASREIAAQHDEIARLRSGKRPKGKPGGKSGGGRTATFVLSLLLLAALAALGIYTKMDNKNAKISSLEEEIKQNEKIISQKDAEISSLKNNNNSTKDNEIKKLKAERELEDYFNQKH